MAGKRDGAALSFSRRALLAGGAAFAVAPHALAQSVAWHNFTDDNDLLQLPGAVNGTPAALVLDSGAQGVVLDRNALARLGITETNAQRSITGLNARTQAGVSGPFRLQVGPVDVNIQRAITVDLSLFARDEVQIDVIVGSPLFSRGYVDLDFAGKRVGFATALEPPAGAQEIALTPSGGLRAVDVSLAGGAPVKANFDLGSARALSMSAAQAEASGLLRGVRTSTGMGGGVEGYTQHRLITLSTLRVGPMTFQNVPTTVHDNWRISAPINLGFPIISSFNRFITHYAQNRALVVPGTGPRRALARDRSGLYLVRSGARAEVMNVARGSPAEQAGWRTGEVVTGINGAPLGYSSRYQRGAGAQSVGTVVRYRMADGTTRSLTLADYF